MVEPLPAWGHLERLGRERATAIAQRRARTPPEGAAPRQLLVSSGSSCAAGERLLVDLRRMLAERGLGDGVEVVRVGCLGAGDMLPVVQVCPDGILYGPVDRRALERIVGEHLGANRPVRELELAERDPDGGELRSWQVPFLRRQRRVALRHLGLVDPNRIDDALAAGGYGALRRVVGEIGPEGALEEIKRAGLRERGGAGFPFALKLELVRERPPGERFVVVGGDEGDLAGRIERSLIEGDPHGLVEGAAILAVVVGARRVVVSVRGDRGLAIERLEGAVAAAAAAGLLGEAALGPGRSLEIEVRISACDAVAGDETALLAALEGRRGVPRPRPPHPARHGLHGAPTLTAGVETVYHVAGLLAEGGDGYREIGRPPSTGTKVVWISGSVRHAGLAELPLGITLGEVVDAVGGGPRTGSAIKAVHCGGPAGGLVEADALATELAFESLSSHGSALGSGEIVVLDREVCLLGLVHHFLELALAESCGKCPPCRAGTAVLINLVDRIRGGGGTRDDLEELEAFAVHIQRTSLCVVGQHAPATLLSVLHRFRSEVEAHVVGRTCPAGECYRLMPIRIDGSRCDGCGECVPVCPERAIAGAAGQRHEIDATACTRCGACLVVCHADAVVTG